jgi:tetratricopeptide (TPR) repeat protein
LHALLGDAHLDCREERRDRRRTEDEIALGMDAVLSAGAVAAAGGSAALADASRWVAVARLRAEMAEREDGEIAATHLRAALAQYVQARDLCPLMAKPHVRIAANHEWFARADARGTYLDRALSLVPWDAELWYLRGVQEMADGEPARAAESWRRSLAISDTYLLPVLRRAAPSFDPDEMVARVLPDDPHQLATAADVLFPDPVDVARRRPFLEKAVALLHRPGSPARPADYVLRARLNRALDRLKDAVDDYQIALAREPVRAEWRYEMATVLLVQGRSAEAEHELQTILRADPRHAEARKLAQDLARTGKPGKDRPSP